MPSPSSDDPNEMSLAPPAAATNPAAAVTATTPFGIRRVTRSIAAPVPVPAMRITSATALEVSGNGLPEHLVELLPEERDATQGEDADQRGQQPILEKVLSRVGSRESTERCSVNAR